MADMILPKGIVFNKTSIYEEIAKYDIVPLEKIHAACHVFSTTSRRLDDPTARRLENFWTRVLGGDRRYLPGKIVARIFQSISEEESFVKLRGPSNRYEPVYKPSPPSKVELPTSVQTNTEISEEGLSESKSKGKAKATKSAPPLTKQPHPILKKPRGPSSSGPRPKTRFVSPAGSVDENKDVELASSGSTAVTHNVDSKAASSSTVKEEKKKATNTTPKKKTTFVASTASRRRPAMPRRISSQSSTAVSGSDVGSKEGSSPAGPRQPGPQSSVSVAQPEKSSKRLSTNEGGERLSAKAAGKRPATRPSPDESIAYEPSTARTSSDTRSQPPKLKNKPTDVKQPTPAVNTTEAAMDEGKRTEAAQGGTAHRRSDIQERSRSEVPPIIPRAKSDVSAARRSSQDWARVPVPPQALISTSTATISHENAQGTIIEFDENTPAYQAVASAAQGQEDVESGSRRSGSSILESARFTPTQPSTTPSVPLGRSKSQLTLLLERKSQKKGRR
ncbi:hypothetical protein GGR52DRAFT_591383 [Hypoxylon sp. FL1284]|nr:hypothetical protein GGR52DRAFT_591383 [Hypoxylon sp. FL1284]